MKTRRSHQRTLTLDKENKKFLGVCAGIADYLEVEPWSIRLVFLASLVFGGWFLVPLYFVAWLCLNDKTGETKGSSSLTDSQPLKHFRTVDYGKKIYRNPEDGKVLGICAGVADYLEVNVFAVRLFFLVLVCFTAALPLFLYFGAYFILEEKPHRRTHRNENRHSHNSRRSARQAERHATAGLKTVNVGGYASGTGPAKEAEDLQTFDTRKYSKRREFKYTARKFVILQDRLAKMEAYVTSSQFRLHREFKNI